MSGSTALGIVYPTSGDPLCAAPSDPTGLTTALKAMADSLNPIVTAWAAGRAASLVPPRVQVQAGPYTQSVTGNKTVNFTTTVFNYKTSTSLTASPTTLRVPAGFYLIDFRVATQGERTADIGPWEVTPFLIPDSVHVWDFGTGPNDASQQYLYYQSVDNQPNGMTLGPNAWTGTTYNVTLLTVTMLRLSGV